MVLKGIPLLSRRVPTSLQDLKEKKGRNKKEKKIAVTFPAILFVVDLRLESAKTMLVTLSQN